MISFVFFTIPVLLAILIIFIVAGVKSTPEGGGDHVIKNIYIYLVLFATLMMTIGGSVAAFMAVADIVAPAPYHQTFEEFRRWGGGKPYPETRQETDAEETKLSEEELKERYEALVTAERERQVNRAKNNLIKSLGWVVIPLPIFVYFQRRLARKDA